MSSKPKHISYHKGGKSGLDFSQYAKWVNQIGVAKEDFELFLKQFLLEMAQRVVARGKPRTPVDTGFLRNSWYIGSQNIEQYETDEVNEETGHKKYAIDETKSDISSIGIIGKTLYVEIGLGAEYASAVEFGHGSYIGRYMLAISIDEIQQQIPKRFDKEFKTFIKKYGVAD